MAQFDVYPNPNVSVRRLAPYVVKRQQEALDILDTRLVALIAWGPPPHPDARIHLPVIVNGASSVAHLPAVAAIPKRRLGRPVAQLSELREHLGRVFDLILFGFP